MAGKAFASGARVVVPTSLALALAAGCSGRVAPDIGKQSGGGLSEANLQLGGALFSG